MNDITLSGDLLSAGTALSGLILVFLGGVVNAYEGYELTQRPAVKGRFRIRGWTCFGGFLLSLLGTVFAFLANLNDSIPCLWASAITLAVALVVLLLLAFIEVRGI
jgi:hypothetical protein